MHRCLISWFNNDFNICSFKVLMNFSSFIVFQLQRDFRADSLQTHCSSLWQSKETSQLNLSTSSLQSQTTSYFEDQCFELCKRWNIISVWWRESSSFNDLLQQKHDSCWNQLSHLWQETASHYSMLQTLIIQAKMHWTTHSDVYQSSSFEDLHEK